MCNKSSSAMYERRTRARTATVASSKPPARKIRTKTRKPKYLSLKLELSSHKCNKKTRSQEQKHPKMPNHKRQHQLNLFPLHPENLVQLQDKVDMQEHDDHVALLFETATDTSTNTLQGLLDSTTTTTTTTVTTATTTTTTTTTTSEESPLSPRLHWGCDHGEDKGGGSSSLERTAMRCKGRDASEERWVSYCEVVNREQDEVSSTTNHCSGAGHATGEMMPVQQEARQGLVGLKLDYQEIMNAWCDKGPLYVEGESSQTVPDISLDGSDANVGSMGNSWAVPEMADMNMKFWLREASVLRYKEKRRNRLFSKRIRYEVRKLNAEKRPRLKGRFVKRNEEL